MRYFVAAGETKSLDADARRGSRGEFATLSDGVTHHEIAGPSDGDLVVFVPGLTIPLDFWDNVIDSFHRRGLRTLTYSAYGRGLSDRVRTDYGQDLFVRQLGELLDQIDARRFHLVGSSMGALIALAYAPSARGRLTSLVISGPAGLGKKSNPVSRLPKRGPVAPLLGKRVLRKSLLRHLAHNVRDADDAARLREIVLAGFAYEGSTFAVLSTLMYFPLTDRGELFEVVDHARVPTLLLWGSEDQVTPAVDYGRGVELLRPAEDRLIDGSGHMVSFERPAEFSELVGAFLVEQMGR